jgi:hydroxymethylpyrimidine pyrophosphatase-like HAD family hydrolase
MRYMVLAIDYDGSIATDGRVDEAALSAIKRLRMSGRRAILVTGRRVGDLLTVCPRLELFDYVVAENGAVIYEPRSRTQTLLAKPPPIAFVERLREMAVEPLTVGNVILATWLPHHVAVLKAIQEMGLELQVIFNRNAVMVLPGGVNKASGMEYALRKLGFSWHEAIGVGNGDNDHSFLERCECAVALANAVPSIRERAAFTTKGVAGSGVVELIDELIATDLSRLAGKLPHNLVVIGSHEDGTPVTVPPYGLNILIAGPSASGKSTLAVGIIERLIRGTYQVCIVDPEGDYGTLRGLVTLGGHERGATVHEVLAVLDDPTINLNVNLLGIPLVRRPEYFGHLFPSLQAMRTRTGRPHWIVLDEAHHMLPADWGHLGKALPQELGETVLITVHPEHLAPMALSLVHAVIAVGPVPMKTLKAFAHATGQKLPSSHEFVARPGHAVCWYPRRGEAPFYMKIIPGRTERLRHLRKYAEGNMRNNSFYFRGPSGRHNLLAQNLAIFSQIADGIDEETWLFHLHRGDYSQWFRKSVKDSDLADQMEQIEQRRDLSSAESRELVRSLIEGRYTLPA